MVSEQTETKRHSRARHEVADAPEVEKPDAAVEDAPAVTDETPAAEPDATVRADTGSGAPPEPAAVNTGSDMFPDAPTDMDALWPKQLLLDHSADVLGCDMVLARGVLTEAPDPLTPADAMARLSVFRKTAIPTTTFKGA